MATKEGTEETNPSPEKKALEEEIKALKKIGIEMTAEQLELQKKIQTELQSTYDLEKKSLLIANDLLEKNQQLEKTKKDAQQSLLDIISKEERRKDLLKEIKEIEIEIFDNDGKIDEAKAKQLEHARAELKLTEKALETRKEDSKAALEKLENAEKELKLIEKQLESIEKEKKLREEIGEKLKESVADVAGLGNVFSNVNSGLSVGSSLLVQFTTNANELLKSVLDGNREFAAATGQIAERSVSFGYGASQFGIGFEKLNKASIALFQNMSNFSNQTVETQEKLGLAAAKLELLGIGAGETAKNFQDLTLGLKMSSNEAIQTTELLAREAIGAGIAPAKMVQGLANEMPRLAAYGKQGVQVYIDMQKAAKSLGLEMSQLNSVIGDQFDTFEGAARAAGKFNAVLGGNYLNSVEMLNATESDRILILKRSFEESGKNFDSLSKYEKKAVAATLGIKDINEASKLFGKSTTELTADMEKKAATEEKLAAVEREAAETTAQVKEVFNALLIAVRPLVEIIKTVINVFTRLNDFFGGFPAVLLVVHLMVTRLAGGWSNLASMVGTASKSIIGFFINFGDNAKAAWASGSSFVNGMLGKFGDFRKSAEESGGVIKMFKDKVTDFFKSAAEQGKIGGEAGGSIQEKITEGIKGKVEGLGGAPAEVPSVSGKAVEGASKAGENAKKAGGFKSFMRSIRQGFQEFAKDPGKTLIGAATFAAAALIVSTPLIVIGALIASGVIEPVGVLAFTAGLVLLGIAMKIIAQIASPDLIIKGAIFSLAALTIGIGLTLMSMAMKKMTDIDYKQVMLGLLTIGLLVGAVALLGAAFTGPQAAALLVGSAVLLGLSAVFLVFGASLLVLSAGLKSMEGVSKVLPEIGLLVAGIALLGAVFMGPQLAALELGASILLGLSGIFLVLGASLFVLGGGLKIIEGLTSALPSQILLLSQSLAALSVALLSIMLMGGFGLLGFGAFVSGLVMMTTAVYALSAALSSIPEEKSTVLKTFNETLVKASTITEDDIKPTKDFVEVIKTYYTVQATSKDAEKDAILSILKEISAMNAQNKEETTQQNIPIKLVISGNDLATAMNSGNSTVSAVLTGPVKLTSGRRGGK